MIVASDLEGTLTSGATWKGLGGYLKAHGRAAAFNRFYLPRLPLGLLYRLNLVNRENFRNQWIAGLLRLFGGMPFEDFKQVAAWVVEHEMWPQRRDDVLAELAAHQQAGHRVIITSGSYEPIVAAFARRAGITEVVATPIEVQSGVLTGRPGGARNTGPQKADALRARLGAAPDLAYGDTMADRPMLEMSAEAVAVFPEKPLMALAEENGWRVIGQPK